MFKALRDKLRIRWLLRDEYESTELRRWFAARWGVEAGLYSYGCFDPWRVPARTRIGRYCSFAKTARVLDANHPIEALTTHPFLYEARFGVVPADRIDPAWLEIGDDVWISHNATIAPGCKSIGRGAIIGAGAVVTHDVAPYTIVAGLPARPLRARFDAETIAAIEQSRWWELDKAALRRMIANDAATAFAPAAGGIAAAVARARGIAP
ncbi:CatB-related O-acetyltransferase [Glacieibacterium sp.]|uniref:CatB-related O-acetyltransferase n=1 Tax=Glacieibacterium sp. TaxID=2860237 RepID=UPI003B00212F